MTRIGVILFLLLLSPIACSKTAALNKNHQSRLDCGVIDPDAFPSIPHKLTRQSVDKFIAENQDSELAFLRIDSDGGHIQSGIKFGQFLSVKNVTGVVTERCHSACLDYVAPVMEEIVVCPNGFLSAHGGVIHLRKALENETVYDQKPDWRDVKELLLQGLSAVEQTSLEFLNEHKISPELSKCSGEFAAIAPLKSPLMRIDGEIQRLPVPLPEYDKQHRHMPSFWAPTLATLEKTGYPPIFGWSNDPEELRTRWIEKGYDASELSVEISKSLLETGRCAEFHTAFE